VTQGYSGEGAAPFPGASGYYTSSAQELLDGEHLRLLRIGYFISAAQTAFFIPVGLLYAGLGVMMTQLPHHGPPSSAPPAMFSWFMGGFGAAFALAGTVGAGLKLLKAIRLKERRSRTLCLVTAALSCLEIPYGTALGVMTFTVLGRGTVRQLFEANGG
jgi:hypothetical protein